MNKKSIVALLTASLCALTLTVTGCGDSKDDNTSGGGNASAESPVTIKWGVWGSSQDIETFNKMADGVNEVVPEVKNIEVMHYASTDDFWSGLPSQVAAGTAPDMALPTNENAYEFINGGLFIPLDTDAIDVSKIDENAIRIWTVDDKLYGFPIDAQPTCFLINLDMWEAAGLTEADYPKTWDDVRAAAEKLTTDDVTGICINMESTFHITQVVQSFGGGWGEGKTIDSAENAEGLQWVIDMFKDGLAVSSKQIGDDWEGTSFAQNHVAMTMGGTWFRGQMQTAAPDTNYIALPIPQKDPANPASALHSDAIVIFKSCENVAAASKAAEYLAREDCQQIRAEGTGNIPSIPELYEKYYEDNPQFASLKGTESYSIPFGYPAKTSQFQTAFVNEATKVLYDSSNNGTAEEILAVVAETYGPVE